VPQVEVTFDIDANGIVHVSAKDKATGKEQSIRIQASGGLSDSDIERMVKEAEEHAVDDKKKRELVEAKNQAEALVHATEKQLQENESNAAVAAVKSDVEKAIEAVKAALAKDDAEEIKSTTTALAQVAMKIGEAIYAAKGGDGDASSGDDGPSKGGDDNVVDADFEEVKDDKKQA
ncbi:MAG TPA: Hsp70 family protein, partial [Hyphomicrobium sp.]|nr:Hsp70 family protein [Hyphomicrobium sp.]